MLKQRDIEAVIAEVRRGAPVVQCEETYSGLWYFDVPASGIRVHVESWNGECPFHLENYQTNASVKGETVAQTVRTVLGWLRGE